MKLSYPKIALLAILYFGIFPGQSCKLCDDCPTVEKPYFDYGTIFLVSDTVASQKYEIEVKMNFVFFTADAAFEQGRFNGFMNSAWGCSCEEEGYLGDKFPISQLDITANRAFEGVQAGQSLNDFFQISVGNGGETPIHTAYQTAFGAWNNSIRLRLEQFPADKSGTYEFTVRLRKSLGFDLFATTDLVVFL